MPLALAVDAVEWMDEANCRNVHPDVFFPKLGEGQGYEAKRVCHSCKVIDVCLEYALALRIEKGVYGGMNAKERRKEARNRKSSSR